MHQFLVHYTVKGKLMSFATLAQNIDIAIENAIINNQIDVQSIFQVLKI